MSISRVAAVERAPTVLAFLIVGALVASFIPLVDAEPAQAQTTYTLGVDVSHHQEDPPKTQIDWNQVVDSGHVYAFHKATEGATFEDLAYDGNRTDAGAANIPFGAYHFARPDGGTIAAAQSDAAAEAQHFLNVAQPAPGDLLPVLDMEATGGLPAQRLIAWTQAWLDAVEAALNVQPLIYTGPNFWTTNMNDTTTFADQGFPLWLAHYTSDPAPRVPGANWGGNGWSFWQWTSSAQVPGISGNVDENRYPSSDLSPFIIPGSPEPQPSPGPGTPPSNTSPPTISGETEVGATLTADEGAWSGTEPISYSFAWFRCSEDGSTCSGIPHEATDSTYKLEAADFGSRMKVEVTATNGSGSDSVESALTETVTDATPPEAPRLTKPRRQRTLSTTVNVVWTHPEQGSATFDVRYRRAPRASGFGDYAQLVADTTDPSATLEATTGSTYCFSSRATDEAGNTSAWSSERCTNVPLDDGDLRVRTGEWSRRSGSGFYLQSFTKTKQSRASLVARDIRVRDIYLVAQRCPGCGTVAILFNGTRVKTISLDSERIRNKRVIHAAGFASIRRGTVEIVAVSRAAPVKIDGLALSL